MDSLDSLQLDLSNRDLFWINVCLAFLMFGVSLDIQVSDFKRAASNLRALFVGLISQWLILPALTLLLVFVLNPHPGIALGMLLVAVCPGGNVSNFLVHMFNGNRALSVSLTSISTVSAAFYTPAALWFWASWYSPAADLMRQFEIDFAQLLMVLTQLVIVPLVLGMSLRHYFPSLVSKVKRWVRNLSIAIFLGILVLAVFANLQQARDYLYRVFGLVLLHNGIAFLSAWFFSGLMRLHTKDRRTITMETGIQNSGLGLIIIFNFYNSMGAMVLITAWWAVWHLVSGFALSLLWMRMGERALYSVKE